MMHDFNWPLMNRVELHEVTSCGYYTVGIGATLAHAIMDFMMRTFEDHEYMVQSVGATQAVLRYDLAVFAAIRDDPEVPDWTLTLEHSKRTVYMPCTCSQF